MGSVCCITITEGAEPSNPGNEAEGGAFGWVDRARDTNLPKDLTQRVRDWRMRYVG